MKTITAPRFTVKLVREDRAKYVPAPIKGPEDTYSLIRKLIADAAEEIFMVLALDSKNQLIGSFEVSRGTVNSSLVHPREVFKRLIACNAASFICAHNHPTGGTKPSFEDLEITERLVKCGKLMGVQLLDHIITGDNELSIRENHHELWASN